MFYDLRSFLVVHTVPQSTATGERIEQQSIRYFVRAEVARLAESCTVPAETLSGCVITPRRSSVWSWRVIRPGRI